jgi:sulfur carrier protein
VKLSVNGEPQHAVGPLSVDGLIGELGLERRGLAIAVNGEVVPRSVWGDQALVDGDQVEILTVAQGG